MGFSAHLEPYQDAMIREFKPKMENQCRVYSMIKGYFWTADILLGVIFFMTLPITSFKSFNSVSLLSFRRLRVHRNMAIEY